MAKIKFGALAAEVRGSISGVTFARNKGGAYIRNRTTPLDPSSSLQTASRITFRDAVSAWTDSLTLGQRLQWNYYAEQVPYTDVFGEQRYMTGQQRFVQAYTSLIPLGVALSSFAEGPANTELPMLPQPLDVYIGIEDGGDPAEISIGEYNALTSGALPIPAPVGTPVGTILQFRISRRLFPGSVSVKTSYRNAGYTTATDSPSLSWPALTVANPWAQELAKDDLVVLGMRALIPDGRVSSWQDSVRGYIEYPGE